jgi:type VI secretion system protein ImpH
LTLSLMSESAPVAQRETDGIESDLVERAPAFSFFQAVRLLERRYLPASRPGEGGRLDEERIRFRSHVSFVHPTTEIVRIERDARDSSPSATVVATFLGVAGPLGVGTLPSPYAELILSRLNQERDSRLLDFLDLFNHRLLAFFYRAWAARRPYVLFEQGRARAAKDGSRSLSKSAASADRFTRALSHVVGLGGLDGWDKLGFPDEVCFYYAGLLARRSRSAAALQALLASYFGVAVEVIPFVGRWYAIEPSERTRLGEAANACLGESSVLGDSAWDASAGLRLRIGPLDEPKFRTFLPLGGAARALGSICKFVLSGELDVEVQLVLAGDQLPRWRLGGEAEESRALLGWSTWLPGETGAEDRDDALFSLGSPAETPAESPEESRAAAAPEADPFNRSRAHA